MSAGRSNFRGLIRKHPGCFALDRVRGAPLIGPELRTSLKELVDAKAAAIRSWSETGRLAPVEPYHLIFTIWSTTQHCADFADQVEAVVGRRLLDDAFSSKLFAIPRPSSSTALSRDDAGHVE